MAFPPHIRQRAEHVAVNRGGRPKKADAEFKQTVKNAHEKIIRDAVFAQYITACRKEGLTISETAKKLGKSASVIDRHCAQMAKERRACREWRIENYLAARKSRQKTP
jgi:cytosine/adenosine deaminase-related metal-dependent hydrolase